MPLLELSDPFLKVDERLIKNIDTRNVANLYGLWSGTTEHGKRFENMSWRIWSRETFCCSSERSTRCSHSQDRWQFARKHSQATPHALPALSSSEGSVASDFETEAMTVNSTPSDIARPELRRLESSESSRSRGREKHITPIDLQHIVTSIKEKTDLEPLSPLPMPAPVETPVSRSTEDADITPRSTSPPSSRPMITESSTSTVATITSNESGASPPVGSEASTATELSSHSIVRGFSPGQVVTSYKSSTNLNARPTPILKTAATKTEQPLKKKAAMFTLGGSSGEGDESSFENHMYRSGRSSLSDGLHMKSKGKQTSFKEEVSTRTISARRHEQVFDDSDDEEEEVSESAIEDEDDEGEWEDSISESDESEVDQTLFKRVDSRPNLVSRRSLLTTMIHEPDRAAALQNAASRSTPMIRRSRQSTPNGPSIASSPQDGPSIELNGSAISRSRPIIMTTSNVHPPALSPRTTRRNMLSTEMTESLRKNLLWERQIKTATTNALKRRHTSHDVKNLQAYPQPQPQPKPEPKKDGSKNSSWSNVYFDHGLGEYHNKGW